MEIWNCKWEVEHDADILCSSWQLATVSAGRSLHNLAKPAWQSFKSWTIQMPGRFVPRDGCKWKCRLQSISPLLLDICLKLKSASINLNILSATLQSWSFTLHLFELDGGLEAIAARCGKASNRVSHSCHCQQSWTGAWSSEMEQGVLVCLLACFLVRLVSCLLACPCWLVRWLVWVRPWLLTCKAFHTYVLVDTGNRACITSAASFVHVSCWRLFSQLDKPKLNSCKHEHQQLTVAQQITALVILASPSEERM